MPGGPADVPRLGPFLDDLARRYHQPRYLTPDPLEIPHEYRDDADREVAAFLASALAYGRVAQILVSTRRVLAALGPSPARTLRQAEPGHLADALAEAGHRFSTGCDVAALCHSLGESLRQHGSLAGEFVHVGLGGRPVPATTCAGEFDLVEPLERWFEHLRGRRFPACFGPAPGQRPSFAHLLPQPATGSACKRAHLFLRWMIRLADGVDLGLWAHVAPPAVLLMPVDTHVLRLSQNLGLTTRRDASLATSRAITAALARVAPQDPVRYDFALTRLGILAECPTRERLEKCAACGLSPACQRRAALEATVAAGVGRQAG